MEEGQVFFRKEDATRAHVRELLGEEVAEEYESPERIRRGPSRATGELPYRDPFLGMSGKTSKSEQMVMGKSKMQAEKEHQSTMKFLEAVERRSAQASVKITMGHRALEKKRKDTPFQTKRQAVAAAKQSALKNMKAHIETMAIEDIQLAHEKQVDKMKNDHEIEVKEYQQRISELEIQAKTTEEQLEKERKEMKSVRHVTKLLRKKLERVNKREVDNERKLEVFARLEPIFDKLAHQFDFRSAEDVVRRFESLENVQLSSYTDLLELHEQKAALERKLSTLQEECDRESRARQLTLMRKLDKAEALASERQESIDEALGTVDRAMKFKDDYLALSSAVMELYNVWMDSNKLPLAKNAAGQPTVANPLDAVAALHQLFTEGDPTAAAKAVHELHGLANMFWWKYFDHSEMLRSRPRAIFEGMGKVCWLEVFAQSIQMMDVKLELIVQLQRHVHELEKGMRERDDWIDRLEREKRAMQAAMDKKAHLRRSALRPTTVGVDWAQTKGDDVASTASYMSERELRPSTAAANVVTGRSTLASRSEDRPVDLTSWEEAMPMDGRDELAYLTNAASAAARSPSRLRQGMSSLRSRPSTAPLRRKQEALKAVDFSSLEKEIESDIEAKWKQEKDHWAQRARRARQEQQQMQRPQTAPATKKKKKKGKQPSSSRYEPLHPPTKRFFSTVERRQTAGLAVLAVSTGTERKPVVKTSRPSSRWKVKQSRNSPGSSVASVPQQGKKEHESRKGMEIKIHAPPLDMQPPSEASEQEEMDGWEDTDR